MNKGTSIVNEAVERDTVDDDLMFLVLLDEFVHLPTPRLQFKHLTQIGLWHLGRLVGSVCASRLMLINFNISVVSWCGVGKCCVGRGVNIWVRRCLRPIVTERQQADMSRDVAEIGLTCQSGWLLRWS